jgi:hypothetical protein
MVACARVDLWRGRVDCWLASWQGWRPGRLLPRASSPFARACRPLPGSGWWLADGRRGDRSCRCVDCLGGRVDPSRVAAREPGPGAGVSTLRGPSPPRTEPTRTEPTPNRAHCPPHPHSGLLDPHPHLPVGNPPCWRLNSWDAPIRAKTPVRGFRLADTNGLRHSAIRVGRHAKTTRCAHVQGPGLTGSPSSTVIAVNHGRSADQRVLVQALSGC